MRYLTELEERHNGVLRISVHEVCEREMRVVALISCLPGNAPTALVEAVRVAIDVPCADGKLSNTLVSMLTTVCVKFPDDDLAILEAIEAHERLKRSDIVRRAIRAYARQLGVLDAQPPPKKISKPKRK